MSWANYQCTECGDLQEYKKTYGVDFPEKVACPFCKTETAERIFTKDALLTFEVAEGRAGNAKTGYKSSIVSHPSSLTPMNKTGGKSRQWNYNSG